MPGLHHAPGSPGVGTHLGNPSAKVKCARTMTESESADKTMKAGIFPPFFGKCNIKTIVPSTEEKTPAGSDYGVTLAPSQHV